MDVHACPHPGCDLPAETLDRLSIDSTDEPVEHVRLLCISGHRFFMPLEMVPGHRPEPAARRCTAA
jgi:hypothetical protein